MSNVNSKELSAALSKNSHSLVVLSPDETIDFTIVYLNRQGLSESKILEWFDRIILSGDSFSAATKMEWQAQKGSLKDYGAFLPVFSDAKALSILALEMKRSGNILAKYRVNTYKGKSYLVLEGYAGLRQQLQGTRYLASNPKVVSMALGKMGAKNAIKGGVVISVVFSVAFHALEQLMNDRATWHYFVAGITVDMIAAVAGAGIAWTTVTLFVGASAMVAIGPIALVVIVGGFATAGLGFIANQFGLTDKLAKMLREAEQRMSTSVIEIKKEVRKGLNYANEDPVGFMHRLFGVPYYR